MKALASIITRHDKLVFAVIVVITLFFGYHAREIRIENAVDILLPKGSPEKAFYEEIVETFGSEEVNVIAVLSDDIFNSRTLAKVRRITNQLEEIEGIERVVSISNITNVWSTEEGITISPLIREIPESPASLERLRRDVYENPLFRKTLVSEDGTATSISIFFDRKTLEGEAQKLRRVEDRIREILRAEQGPETIYMSGLPHLKVESVRTMEREAVIFLAVAVLLNALILYVFFRSLRGVLLPLVCILVCVLWTLGFMVLCGSSINLGTMTLPTMLAAIGLAYTMHVLSAYHEEASNTPPCDRKAVVTRTLEHISLAVLIAGATTLAGFASLGVSRIPAIREVGIFAVFGIFAATILALTLLPVMLCWLKVSREGESKRSKGQGKESGILVSLLIRLGQFDLRHRKAILLGTSAIILLGLLGASRVRVETDFVSFFPEDSELRIAHRAVGENLAGSQPFYVSLQGKEPDTLKDPEVLRAIDGLQGFLLGQEGVEKVLSIVDYVKLIHQKLNGGNPEYFRVPDTRDEIAQYLLLYSLADDEGDLDRLVDFEYKHSLMLVTTNITGSVQIDTLMRRIDAYCREHLPSGLRAAITGNLILLTRSSDEVARGQVATLGLALLVIFVIMSLLFLSLRTGLLSMIPNIVPIVLFFGFMGLTGITLNLSTSLIACIALGIAVDDTIHYLTRFNGELRRHYDESKASFHTVTSVGSPIVYTSVVLTVGFLTGTLSSFEPLAEFGFLGALVMVVALLGDLVLLPALLATTKIITLWDLLTLKLGKDPQKKIPVFEGLRPAQAKLIVLMSNLSRYTTGERILEKGNPGESMYVVLSGEVEVYDVDPATGEKKVLNAHRTGEIFGEMAALRQGSRTAHVEARDETELMEVNRSTWKRLRRRYPRIAMQFFYNLSRILGDRLERITRKYVEG